MARGFLQFRILLDGGHNDVVFTLAILKTESTVAAFGREFQVVLRLRDSVSVSDLQKVPSDEEVNHYHGRNDAQDYADTDTGVGTPGEAVRRRYRRR